MKTNNKPGKSSKIESNCQSKNRVCQSSAQMCSLRKFEKAISRGSNNKKAVVSSPCSKVLVSTSSIKNKSKKPKAQDQPDESLVTPRTNDHVYIDKVDNKKKILKNRHFLVIQCDLNDIAHGYLGIKNNDYLVFVGQFEHELFVSQVYEFIKNKKQYVYINLSYLAS